MTHIGRHARPHLRLVPPHDAGGPTEPGPTLALPAADPHSAARVRLALYAADVGAWDYDLLAGAVWWDSRCGAILGADGTGVRTYADLLALVHPDDRAALTASWQPFLDPAREGECYEHVFRTAAGDDSAESWPAPERRVAVRGRMMFEEVAGVHRATRLLGTIRDVTAEWERDAERDRLLAAERAARHEAEAARERAEAANTVKSQFLVAVSHQFRSVLNSVGGHAQLVALGMHGPVTPAQAAAVARIQQNQRDLAGLLTAVLHHAQLDLPAMRGVGVGGDEVAGEARGSPELPTR